MSARSNLILKHIVTTKQVKAPYAPVKRFDHTEIVQNGFRGQHTYSQRTVQTNDNSKLPDEPSDSMVQACYVNISPGSTGSLLKRAPLKVGKIPTKVSGPVINILQGNGKLPDHLHRDISGFNIVSGGFVGSKGQFESFCNGKAFIPKAWTRRIRNIESFDKRHNLTRTLLQPKRADIHFMPFKGSSLPGGDMTGSFTTKQEAWSTSAFTANRLWRVIHASPNHNVSIYTVGGRNKVVSDRPGERLTSRMVCQQDIVEFMVAKPYVYPIEQEIFNNLISPIKVGKSLKGFRYMSLLKTLTWYPFGLEFDWKLYDSTVNPEYIVAAFAWCRSLFPESEEIDNAFCYFCQGYLHKYMVTADGNTFRVRRGTPSGSAWTTIINSVVNALLLEDICTHYGRFGGKEFDYIVAGDDGIIFWNEKFNFKSENLVKWVKERYDMDLEVTAVGPPISNDPNKSLTFNKKCFYWDGETAKVTTQPKLLAKRLFPLETHSANFIEYYNTLEGQTAEIVNHDDCLTIIKEFSACIHKVPDPESDWSVAQRSVMRNQMLFTTPHPEKLFNGYEYSVDKVDPLYNTVLWSQKVDMDIVENWLKDNTIAFSRARVNKRARLRWLVSKTGPPTDVTVLWRLLILEKINPVNFNVPQELINKIYKQWKLWYNINPEDAGPNSYY